MKTAIVFYSQHHSNTKKLIDAIAEKHEVSLIDVTKGEDIDLSEFELVGFASDIYYSKFSDKVVEYARKNLTKNEQKVFFLFTYGAKRDSYLKDITEAVAARACEIVGKYGCAGFDTYGPFKLVGGLQKGHPDADEIAGAVKFFEGLK